VADDMKRDYLGPRPTDDIETQLGWHLHAHNLQLSAGLIVKAIEEIGQLRAENKRLRAAGDALADLIAKCGCVDDWERCDWCIAKDKWEEARRG